MGKELILFMKSLWYGAALLMVYDCLRILRRVFSHSNGLVAFEDLLFWTGSSLFLFSRFFRENAGALRAYLFAGVAAGMLAWHFSLSSFLVDFISGRMRKVRRKILIWVKRLKFWILRCRITLDKRPDKGEKHGKEEKSRKKKKSKRE